MAMLQYWEDAATHRIIARMDTITPGLPRLMALAEAVNEPHDAQGGPGAEMAIRSWGRAFLPAAEAVARIDDQRLAFLRDCVADVGASAPELPALIYAAHLGLEQLSLTSDVKPVDTMISLIRLIAVPRPE